MKHIKKKHTKPEKSNKRHITTIWTDFEKKTTKTFTESQIKMWDTLIFLTRFSLLAIPLHLIIWTGYDFSHIITITSYFTSKIISVLGTDFFRIENTFFISTTTGGLLIADVIKDCSGWKSFLALFSLIAATRYSTIKAKSIGIIIGTAIIFTGNIIRLATTFHITYLKGLEMFDITHNLLWQGGLIILVIASWWIWLEKIAFDKRYI